MTGLDSIIIRRANSGDARSLDRLAGLDSKRVPTDDLLIAEVAGEPWALIGIRGGAVVADPFRPTDDLVKLLQLRAESVRGSGTTSGSRLRLRRRLVPAAGSGA